MNFNPQNVPKFITPEEFLGLRLNPVGQELARMGANHTIVAYLPDHSKMHIVSNVPTSMKVASMRQLARALNDAADQFEKPAPAIIRPK